MLFYNAVFTNCNFYNSIPPEDRAGQPIHNLLTTQAALRNIQQSADATTNYQCPFNNVNIPPTRENSQTINSDRGVKRKSSEENNQNTRQVRSRAVQQTVNKVGSSNSKEQTVKKTSDTFCRICGKTKSRGGWRWGPEGKRTLCNADGMRFNNLIKGYIWDWKHFKEIDLKTLPLNDQKEVRKVLEDFPTCYEKKDGKIIKLDKPKVCSKITQLDQDNITIIIDNTPKPYIQRDIGISTHDTVTATDGGFIQNFSTIKKPEPIKAASQSKPSFVPPQNRPFDPGVSDLVNSYNTPHPQAEQTIQDYIDECRKKPKIEI